MISTMDKGKGYANHLLLALTALGGGFWAATHRLSLKEGRLAVVLVLGGWLPFWSALATTDWATAFNQWRAWQEETPLPRPPYWRTGGPGDRLHHAIAAATRWWQAEGQSLIGSSLRRAGLAVLIALLLAAWIGTMAMLLTLLFFALVELATLWHDGKGVTSPLWAALSLVGTPWLFGMLLVRYPPLGAALMALSAATLTVAMLRPHGLNLIGVIPALSLLIWRGEPLAAGWLVLTLWPVLRLELEGIPPSQFWLLLALLIFAGA